MDVTIRQRKLTLRSKYDISTPVGHYYAERNYFLFSTKLQSAENGRLLVKLRYRWSLFRSRYDFEFSDGRLYHFQCQKFWKGVFKCEGAGQALRLYQHRGLNYSVFRNDTQIAAFAKGSVTFGKGDRYEVRMNADADLLIVICLVLTLEFTNSEGSSFTVNFDFGNIGPEDRPFDKSWEPN